MLVLDIIEQAIKGYWAWQTRPGVSFLTGAFLSGATVKFDLLTWALSFV